jgi:hypothetical protein
MSRTKKCLAVVVMGASGSFLAVPLLSPGAVAGSRGGVPCLGLLQTLASSPAAIPEALQTATSSVTGGGGPPPPPFVVPPASSAAIASRPTPPLPAASVTNASAAVTAPGPPLPSAPIQGASGVASPPAPSPPAPGARVEGAAAEMDWSTKEFHSRWSGRCKPVELDPSEHPC